MSTKTGKILVGIGLGILGIFGGYKLVKAYKKGMEELENQELKETEDLENAGVNTSKLKDEIKDEEEDFTRMLYVASRFNSELDEDLFDVQGEDGVIDNLDKNVIHVRQRFDTKGKNGEGRRRLDFIVDIPNYTVNSYRGPKIGNFLTTFKDAAITMSSEIVKFSNPATRKLICNVVLSRNRNGSDVVEYREIIPEIYGKYADDEHDGITKFYETEITRWINVKPSELRDYTRDTDWLYENCPDLKKDDPTLLIEGLVLQYVISFPIRSSKPGELYGIDVHTGVECVKYLTEKVMVGREDSRYKVTYRHLMFNAPNDEGNPDLSWYYDTDSDNKVVIDNIAGFED